MYLNFWLLVATKTFLEVKYCFDTATAFSKKKKKNRNITKAIENNKPLERNCFIVSDLTPSICGQVVKSLLNSSGFIDSSKNTTPTSLGCQMSSCIRHKKRRQGKYLFLFYLEWLNF